MSEVSEVTISYLILCHDSPDRIVRLVTRILSNDETGQVVIHFDKNSSRAKFNELKSKLHDIPRSHILDKRVKCGWGQWGLVEAAVDSLNYAFYTYGTDYYYLVSEFCYPIKPLDDLKRFLGNHKGISFLECEDESWIKGGIRKDRYLCYHIFNKRNYPRLHNIFYKLQKKVNITRSPPKELEFSFGSQWWCLHKSNISTIIEAYGIYRNFFRYAWIPDELFFPTIARSYRLSIKSICLTWYDFDDSGRPRVIDFNDKNSVGQICSTNCFFARKVF